MTTTEDQIPDAAVTALQNMNSDPFVQAATWRLFKEAPHLLNPTAVIILTHAEAQPAQDHQ